MSQNILSEDLLKKINEARQDLFAYNIELGTKKIIDLLGQLTSLAKANGKENSLNQIALRLMTAMKHKDYLLFADIASFEIPALFDREE